ncbi:MAG TPA: transporter [Thiobacillus sp.]|nr:transporter [Thiobacillus sp.]
MPTIPHLYKRRSKALALSAITTATLLAFPAHAIDVDAGDYTALPAGTSLGLVYYQHATRDKLYAGGNQVAINPKLTSDIGIVRGVHFMEIGGYIVDPQFLLPFGKLSAKNDIAALGSNSGVGDLQLAATVWLTKPGDKTHFGITPFISAPTGQYDRNDPLSLGENRWKYALQAGFITPLADKVMLDLAADVQIHGKNKDFGASSATMEQKPLFQAQAFLRYQLSATTDLRTGVSHTTGGQTTLNGVRQDDRIATTKFQVGVAHFLSAKTQVLATYGRDTSVRQGFKEDGRINLRLLQIF